MKTLNEMNRTVAKAFIMMLKAHNAFIPYVNATKYKTNTSTFTYFLTLLRNGDDMDAKKKWGGFIFSSFAWFDTKECKVDPTYWSKLNVKWGKILEKLRNNNYEISENLSRAILSRSD